MPFTESLGPSAWCGLHSTLETALAPAGSARWLGLDAAGNRERAGAGGKASTHTEKPRRLGPRPAFSVPWACC